MPILFLEYPKCPACQKAKRQPDTYGIFYEDRHIKEQNPTVTKLQEWHRKSGQPLKKLLNTSGLVYKDLQLKDRLPSMSEQRQFELLFIDGVLARRPLITGDDFVLIGFKEAEWRKTFL